MKKEIKHPRGVVAREPWLQDRLDRLNAGGYTPDVPPGSNPLPKAPRGGTGAIAKNERLTR